MAMNEWNAAYFFSRLLSYNKFALENGFKFARVSSLEGFEELISRALTVKAYVAVSDTSQGTFVVNNTPHTRRVKTVFMFMRHKVDDMAAREKCMAKIRELFRQFMSVLLLERTRIKENFIYIDENVSFTEIDRYFYTGGACAYFQIYIDTFTDISYNQDEWTTQP